MPVLLMGLKVSLIVATTKFVMGQTIGQEILRLQSSECDAQRLRLAVSIFFFHASSHLWIGFYDYDDRTFTLKTNIMESVP